MFFCFMGLLIVSKLSGVCLFVLKCDSFFCQWVGSFIAVYSYV